MHCNLYCTVVMNSVLHTKMYWVLCNDLLCILKEAKLEGDGDFLALGGQL